MKRAIVSLLLFVSVLALPLRSLAGSATSRWDVTIGGMVKFDYGYATQAVGADTNFAQRASGAGAQNAADETSSQFWAAGETRLNIGVKGPGVWGAATSAFVEGDFRGQSGHAGYGTFSLRHALLEFTWPATRLIIGQTWQPWGIYPYLWLLRFDEDGPFNKGIRVPQITVIQRLPNHFSLKGGIASPTEALGSQTDNNVVNGKTKSDWPDVTGEIIWATERFGKVGPWPMELAFGGFAGAEKVQYDRTTGAVVCDRTTFDPSGVAGTSFGSKNLPAWALSFRGFVPLIPQHKPENRQGALGLVFAGFIGQNMTSFATIGTTPYSRGGLPADFAAPTVRGGWANLIYYVTHDIALNGQAAYAAADMSSTLRAAQPNAVQQTQRYTVNMLYDVNAAIRLGIEVSYISTRYGAPVNGLAGWGAFYSARLGAYYFF